MPAVTMNGVCLTDRSQIANSAGLYWRIYREPIIFAGHIACAGTSREGDHRFKRVDSHLPEVAVFGLIFFFTMTGALNAGCLEVDDGWAHASVNRADEIWASVIADGNLEKPDYMMSGMACDQVDPYDALGPGRLFSGENTGDYLNRHWYYFADRWQYYYLDRCQYNLLGGFSYILGHPCYPKLFERGMDQAVGFGGGVQMFWFGVCSYLPIEGGFAQSYYGLGDYRRGVCMPWVGGGVMFPSMGLRFFQTAGDYIDRWHYNYIDKGQYHYLDDRQYKLLGGLGYMYGRACCGGPYDYGRYMWRHGYIGAANNCSSIPEPATVTLFALASVALLRLKRRIRRI